MARSGEQNYGYMQDAVSAEVDSKFSMSIASGGGVCPAGCSNCSKESSGKRFIILLVVSAVMIAGLLTGLLVVLTGAHISDSTKVVTNGNNDCQSPGCIIETAEILAKMNRTISPCDDFYEYSCGNWLKNTFFPPDKVSWTSFSQADESITQLLKKLLETDGSAYRNATSSSAVRKVKDYYSACMNRTAYESQGAIPLQKLINALRIGTLSIGDSDQNNTSSDLQNLLVRIHQMDIYPFFSMGIAPDPKNSSVYSIQFEQDGLILLDEKEKEQYSNEALANAFVLYGTTVIKLLNRDANATVAEQYFRDVWDLEMKISAAFVPREDLRDPAKTYNPYSVKDLQTLFGSTLNVTTYLNSMLGKTISDDQMTIVATPQYFVTMTDIITEYLANDQKRVVLADYLFWSVVTKFVPYLTDEFHQATLILSSVTNDVTSLPSRWETCVSRANRALGFASSALYVEASFLPESKTQVEEILGSVRKSFRDGFHSVDWMNEETKAAAVEKADFIVSKVGYPEWLQYATEIDKYYDMITVTSDDQFANYLEVRQFNAKYKLINFGWSPDRNKWDMVPAEVNAYYDPSFNTIVFPAGILQKPFYSAHHLMAANYGGIGSVVGHELTHGFDDEGRLYDKFGNYEQWWDNSSVLNFQNRAKCVSDQYSQYKVAGSPVNGRLTLGENIADNGGMKASYRALMTWLASTGLNVNDESKLPNLKLSHGQLFFVSYAQVWCSYYQPAYAQTMLGADPHSPPRYRVIGPLSNSVDFATAFSCPAGSAMNPAKKCTVW